MNRARHITVIYIVRGLNLLRRPSPGESVNVVAAAEIDIRIYIYVGWLAVACGSRSSSAEHRSTSEYIYTLSHTRLRSGAGAAERCGARPRECWYTAAAAADFPCAQLL